MAWRRADTYDSCSEKEGRGIECSSVLLWNSLSRRNLWRVENFHPVTSMEVAGTPKRLVLGPMYIPCCLSLWLQFPAVHLHGQDRANDNLWPRRAPKDGQQLCLTPPSIQNLLTVMSYQEAASSKSRVVYHQRSIPLAALDQTLGHQLIGSKNDSSDSVTTLKFERVKPHLSTTWLQPTCTRLLSLVRTAFGSSESTKKRNPNRTTSFANSLKLA